MNFLSSLFGGSENAIPTVFFALGAVLIGILLVLWLLKMLFKASGTISRGRNRRLGVIDTLAIDTKRQLLIVRRDNVEHLLLVGGPQDVVIETGIPVTEDTTPLKRGLPRLPANKTSPAPSEAAQSDIKPASKPSTPSLRHTGLLRATDDSEPAVSHEISITATTPDANSENEEAARREVEGSDSVERTKPKRK
jgi:flagellar protein FliO/FliZ